MASVDSQHNHNTSRAHKFAPSPWTSCWADQTRAGKVHPQPERGSENVRKLHGGEAVKHQAQQKDVGGAVPRVSFAFIMFIMFINA